MRVSTKLSDLQLRFKIDENNDSLKKLERILERNLNMLLIALTEPSSRLSGSLYGFLFFEISRGTRNKLQLGFSSDLITTIYSSLQQM